MNAQLYRSNTTPVHFFVITYIMYIKNADKSQSYITHITEKSDWDIDPNS